MYHLLVHTVLGNVNQYLLLNEGPNVVRVCAKGVHRQGAAVDKPPYLHLSPCLTIFLS